MKKFKYRDAWLALACAASMNVLMASAQPLAPPISAPFEASFQRLLSAPAVNAVLTAIEADDERTLREQIELAKIPSPPFKEALRAAEYARRLQALGLTDVAQAGAIVVT